jgi:dTDP-4-amino-4,6-dideoxygalactose transaminase
MNNMQQNISRNIPQSNPGASYAANSAAIDEAFRRVLASGWYILGREVAAFEEAFASYVGAAHAVGVANGTDALHLALRAIGVGQGDAVLTVSHTAVATVAAIELAGATPVFVDIDPVTFTIDPALLEETILLMKRNGAPRPACVIAVHLYGHPADMPAIMDVAARHDLRVIEDCAQAHGASIGGKRVGSIGDIAAFSFYPTKNLGAFGDGGAVTANSHHLADRVRSLREYGWRERYISDDAGMNSRLDEMQAAMLSVKLESLDAGNKRRAAIAARYSELLADSQVLLPVSAGNVEHVFHQYVVRSGARERLRDALKSDGIGTLIHYPLPVHLQPAYQNRLPLLLPLEATEQAAREVLSLPMYPELSDADVEQVASRVALHAAAPVAV